MIKPKDFMNALVKVRDTHETVTLGRFTFTYLPASHERAHGIARCEYTFRRPVVGDRNEPQDGSVSVGGFAWASTSIVRMGRIFARDNAEMEAQHLGNQAAYLGDQIFEVEQHIEETLVDLSKRNSKAQQTGLRCNIDRLEGIRDDLLNQLNRIDFVRRRDAMYRLEAMRENAAAWRAA
jgi:hypothetical protein